MSKTKVERSCDLCGKLYMVDIGTYNKLMSGKYKHSYCSQECNSLSKRTGNDVSCDNCNKIFYRRKYHIDIGKYNFCSYECSDEYHMKQSRETRKCEQCGKDFYVLKARSQRFCSPRCNSDWQSTLIGKDNPKFNQKLGNCECCGEEFYISNYKANNGQKNFCSIECRQKWYSEVWCQQEEWKNKSRNKILETLSSGKMSSVNSAPQIMVNKLLDKLQIKYDREKRIKFYSIDNYLPEYNLMIEVQGDYWHANPNKYTDNFSERQANGIRRDKAKQTYISKYMNISVLYLWEHDIRCHLDLCENLILNYIQANGKLKNYHSFNYVMADGVMCLKEDIVISYQEQDFNNYKNKIIKAS